MEQNELVKQATVTVTDVAKKGAQYVENAPLIKDFNEEQKKFICENNTIVENKTLGVDIKMKRNSRIRFCNSQRISVISYEHLQLEHCSNSTTNSLSQWH